MLATVLLLAGVATIGPAAGPASAACAAPNRSIGGAFVGEDGRQIAGLVGIVLLDANGGYLGMDGCPQAPGYASHVFINLNQWGAFTLGTDGATSGYQSRWQIDGIPSNAVRAWVEGYPKSNTPDTTGYYGDWTDYRRYGGAMRRGVPIGTNLDLRLPLNCGLGPGGDNGTIEATVTRGGAPASVASAWAFSMAPENAGQILGFVTSEETGSGRFTIRALEPNQNYALQINLTNGASYWFENFGPGVPVQPCTTTTRSFVLDDASGTAIATGGGFNSPGLAVADVAGVRNVFTRAADGSLAQQVDSPGSSPFSLGGQLVGEPDATSWGAGVVDVAVRGVDGAIWWRGYRNGGWGPWTSLGGGSGHSPSITTWGPNRLDVVITGLDGQLWHRWSGNGGATWSGWSGLGGRLTAAPDVAAWGPNRLDVAGRGQDGQLWHLAWSGSSWLPWEALGGRMVGGPAAAGPAANRLELLVTGTDRVVYSMRWTGSGWTGFTNTGGTTLADPDAATSGGVTSIYVRGTDGGVWRTTRSTPASGLTGWSRL